jgi:hypothetical protein
MDQELLPEMIIFFNIVMEDIIVEDSYFSIKGAYMIEDINSNMVVEQKKVDVINHLVQFLHYQFLFSDFEFYRTIVTQVNRGLVFNFGNNIPKDYVFRDTILVLFVILHN